MVAGGEPSSRLMDGTCPPSPHTCGAMRTGPAPWSRVTSVTSLEVLSPNSTTSGSKVSTCALGSLTQAQTGSWYLHVHLWTHFRISLATVECAHTWAHQPAEPKPLRVGSTLGTMGFHVVLSSPERDSHGGRSGVGSAAWAPWLGAVTSPAWV